MCFLFNGNHLYQLLRQISSATVEESGLVSVICEWEGLVSADFKVGRTGYGWFRVVLPFSNYHYSHQFCHGLSSLYETP